MLDITRHWSVFDPIMFGQERVDVVGAGSVGSRIVMELARLGIKNIHVWDRDTIAGHNIANQLFYGKKDVGKNKLDILAKVVKASVGTSLTLHNEFASGRQELGSIVFVATDSMSSRKAIWDGLKKSEQTQLLIETRMGVNVGRVYTVNPKDKTHIAAYKKTLYSSSAVYVPGCGAPITIGATASGVASYAIWQFLQWIMLRRGEEDVSPLDNEIIFGFKPPSLAKRRFL